MNSLLMLSALLLGGDPPADDASAYYVPTPVLQYSAATSGFENTGYGQHYGNSFDGWGWGYPTGNYSGLCPVTRRSVHNMSLWDSYCWETSICGCCGYENGSYCHILFCESRKHHGYGACGGCESGNCGHGHVGYGHEGHSHSQGAIIIEDGGPAGGTIITPPAVEDNGAATGDDGMTRLQGGRYDDFLLEPGEERNPVNAPWIKNTNLRTKPLDSAEPPLRNWLFPRSQKPELPPIAPNEKVTDSAPAADPFFNGQKQK